MYIRRSGRVVLLNELNQIFLFKMQDQTFADRQHPNGKAVWFTVGGGIEEGETFEDAAKRELWEETGLENVAWGQLVWIREVDLLVKNEPTRFIEYYYTARTKELEIHPAKFTYEEEQGYLTHHWWSLDELRESKELIYPTNLDKLLLPIVNGELHQKPIHIK